MNATASAVICLILFIFSITSSAQERVPRFEDSDCAVQLPKDEKARCGYLVVPEIRRIKNRKTIRLPIVILKSESDTPKPDPVLRTFGGPGASSMNLVRSRKYSPWLKDRDMIVFEQRGTRYAQPALDCPEVGASLNESLRKQLDAATTRKNELVAAKACYDRLTKQGIDPAAYNSAESAADIADLRRVLKLNELNLWGLSYSSRLMLNVIRDHPEGIRSVVLESSLPPEVNYDEVGVDGIVYALNELFANCRAEAGCARAYPNLEDQFYAVVARLNKDPIAATVEGKTQSESYGIKLDGNDFVTWIVDHFLSADAAAIADVPKVVHTTFQGNLDIFKQYANAKPGSGGGLGMRYSVWCGEEFPFEDMRKIRAQSTVYPKLNGYEVMSLPDICSVWKVPAAKPIENRPVKSKIPTLIFTAEYDAYTPPVWGRTLASNMKNSFLFEVPWVGHGPAFSVPCVRDMVAEFYDDPGTAPDSACLDAVGKAKKFNTEN